MPPEAVHTSGLTWDGDYLWAIDYVSHKIYKIDYEKSLSSGEAVVLERVDTGLNGSGSIAFFRYKGEKYLAVTDFMNSGYTYLVEINNILLSGSIPAMVILCKELCGMVFICMKLMGILE